VKMIRVIVVGKPKKGFFSEGVREFSTRLSPYKVKVEYIKESGIPRSPSLFEDVRQKEWNMVRRRIKSKEKIFLWDSRGELWNTDTMVSFLKEIRGSGSKIVMVIGGPLGFSQGAYRDADYIVSLSKFTFTHQMALLMVLEQLYRSFKIISGQPYAY